MDKTDIIICELSNEELIAGKPFSHFGWEGTETFSFLTISDGYWNSAKILLEKMQEECNNFAIVDSLIYPLFFNYRHSIELYLKLLFFKYGEQTKQTICDFLKLGHNLQTLWKKLRPYLNERGKHVGISINLNVIDHYVESINGFDPDSMIMRYPVEKNLETNKKHEYHIDFINFGERMNELCDSLRQLDYELSNQILETASVEELGTYLDMIEKYRSQIDIFLSILKVEAKEESIKTLDFHDFIDDITNRKPSEKDKFLAECDSDLLILLDNLFYGGRSVNEHVIRLSKHPVRKQKEFVRFCSDKDGLCFGKKTQEGQINILGKMSSTLLDAISTALSILALE